MKFDYLFFLENVQFLRLIFACFLLENEQFLKLLQQNNLWKVWIEILHTFIFV